MSVVSLHGGPTSLPEPDENCIACLQGLLERAQAGEVIGVAIAARHCDGLASVNIAGKINGYSLLGAMEIARKRVVDWNEG